MIKEATRSDIEAIKLIMRAYENKQNLIDLQAKKYRMNDLFIQEFEGFINKENFSSSPGLKYEFIKKYDEFFDYEIWLKGSEKSLEPLLHDEFIEEYAVKDERLDEVVSSTNHENYTREVFEKHLKNVGYETRKLIINKSPLAAEADFLIENAELLTQDIFKNRKAKIEWTNDLIEKIFINKTLTARFVVNALYQSKDLAFIRRMLTTDFNYKDSGETFDTEMKNMINKLTETYLPPLFDLVRKYDKNALTYDVVSYLLNMKDDLEEDFLLENIDIFIENGLQGSLATYARIREYRSIMVVLKLS
jgi:hypothetical protein